MRRKNLLYLFTAIIAMAFTGCSDDSVEKGDYSQYTSGQVTQQVGDNTLYFYPNEGGMMISHNRSNMTYEKLVRQNGGSVAVSEGGTGIAGLQDYKGTVEIPESVDGKAVNAIDERAFAGNTELTGVVIPSTVTSIGAEAFAQCPALPTITIPESVTEIKSGTFSGKSVQAIEIPKSITKIGTFVFLKNTQLTAVTFADECELTEVGASAFRGCTALAGALTMPDKVTTIGAYAFDGCSKLTELTLPATLTTLNDQCFKGCSKLVKIHIKATTPPTVTGNPVFQSKAKIYIPAGTLEAYKNDAFWSTVSSKLTEE